MPLYCKNATNFIVAGFAVLQQKDWPVHTKTLDNIIPNLFAILSCKANPLYSKIFWFLNLFLLAFYRQTLENVIPTGLVIWSHTVCQFHRETVGRSIPTAFDHFPLRWFAFLPRETWPLYQKTYCCFTNACCTFYHLGGQRRPTCLGQTCF